MNKIAMTDKAISSRLRSVDRLNELCRALGKAKPLNPSGDKPKKLPDNNNNSK